MKYFAYLLTIILGTICSVSFSQKKLPGSWLYMLGFIFGCISMIILIK